MSEYEGFDGTWTDPAAIVAKDPATAIDEVTALMAERPRDFAKAYLRLVLARWTDHRTAYTRSLPPDDPLRVSEHTRLQATVDQLNAIGQVQ